MMRAGDKGPRSRAKPGASSGSKPSARPGPKPSAKSAALKSGVPKPGAPKSGPTVGLSRAFDEARFGADRTLNLRDSLPTGAQAAGRAEAWLRERQATGCGEVLLITGRGRGSLDGVPVVRDAIVRLFTTMRRVGVIAAAREHGPGAFIVDLASLQALVDAPRRRGRRELATAHDAAVLVGLDSDTQHSLRRLAHASLSALGVHEPTESFVADEMIRQFSRIAASVPPGPSREESLKAVVRRALEEFE